MLYKALIDVATTVNSKIQLGFQICEHHLGARVLFWCGLDRPGFTFVSDHFKFVPNVVPTNRQNVGFETMKMFNF